MSTLMPSWQDPTPAQVREISKGRLPEARPRRQRLRRANNCKGGKGKCKGDHDESSSVAPPVWPLTGTLSALWVQYRAFLCCWLAAVHFLISDWVLPFNTDGTITRAFTESVLVVWGPSSTANASVCLPP